MTEDDENTPASAEEEAYQRRLWHLSSVTSEQCNRCRELDVRAYYYYGEMLCADCFIDASGDALRDRADDLKKKERGE